MMNSIKLEPLHMTTTIIPSNLRTLLEYFHFRLLYTSTPPLPFRDKDCTLYSTTFI